MEKRWQKQCQSNRTVEIKCNTAGRDMDGRGKEGGERRGNSREMWDSGIKDDGDGERNRVVNWL